MRSSRSSIGVRLMLSWHTWAWLFFCSSGSATAGLRTGAANNYSIFPGRGLQDGKNDRKKDDKLVETEPPTHQPSPAPYQTQSPTTSSTELFSMQPSFEKQFVEVPLLPFTILIHGSLSIEDELDIRGKLQEYLLKDFLGKREQQAEITIDSIVLDMDQMVESYIPLAEADEGNNDSNKKNLNRYRSLSQIQRRNGHRLGRGLQSASSTSTVSTLVEYRTNAILRFEQLQNEDVIDNKLSGLELEEKQIEALENTGNLQGYFLEWFALEQSVDSGGDFHSEYKNENYSIRDPVVLMTVQIAERPSKSLNSEETWKSIKLILDSSSISNAIDASSDKNGINESEENLEVGTGEESPLSSLDTSAQSTSLSNKRKSALKVAVGIGCALMILVGLGGISLVWRKKNNQYNRKFVFFSKRKRSLSGEVVNHVIGVTNEVDESDEHQDSITKEQNTENRNNISFDSSKTGISTDSQNVRGVVNDSEIPTFYNADDSQATFEGRSSKNSSFTFAPISFLQNSFKGKPQQREIGQQKDDNENDESDSVAAKMNSCNGTFNDDDDSMMGYSLSSLNRDRNDNEGHQDDSDCVENLDSMSVASLESDTCNQVFAGIHKILGHNEKVNNQVQHTAQRTLGGKSEWNNQQYKTRSLLEDGTNNIRHGEPLMKSHAFETEDVESSSTYKNDGSRREDVQSGALSFSSDKITTDALKYYGKDEIMMTVKRETSSGKEFCSPSLILPNQNVEINSGNAMIKKNTHVIDDASDAPSDERNNGRSAAMPSQCSIDHTQYTDVIRNSKLVDNDPAVLDYRVKDTRDIENGTKESVCQ